MALIYAQQIKLPQQMCWWKHEFLWNMLARWQNVQRKRCWQKRSVWLRGFYAAFHMSYEYNRDDNVQILNYSTFYKRRFSEPKGGSSVWKTRRDQRTNEQGRVRHFLFTFIFPRCEQVQREKWAVIENLWSI